MWRENWQPRKQRVYFMLFRNINHCSIPPIRSSFLRCFAVISLQMYNLGNSFLCYNCFEKCNEDVNVLKINLLEIINSLPQHKYAEYGYAVSFADIYDCLKIKGFNRVCSMTH